MRRATLRVASNLTRYYDAACLQPLHATSAELFFQLEVRELGFGKALFPPRQRYDGSSCLLADAATSATAAGSADLQFHPPQHSTGFEGSCAGPSQHATTRHLGTYWGSRTCNLSGFRGIACRKSLKHRPDRELHSSDHYQSMPCIRPSPLMTRSDSCGSVIGGRTSAFATTRRSFSSASHQPVPEVPPAFVFDIDGVLIRGGTVLPQARRALANLYECKSGKPKYPLCFMTNGGGVTEAKKAEELATWLDVDVQEDQVVLAHTPFRRLAVAGRLRDRPVVVAGVGDPAGVAAHYGFRQVVTMEQLHRALPHSVPFAATAPGEAGPANGMGSTDNPIAAILVFKDPCDWYRDAQLALDIVLSGGVPGRERPLEGAPPVQLFISNPDMLWANEFPTSRFGQGAFAAILQTLHREVTGVDLPHLQYFGKPNSAPYRLIEALLLKQAAGMGLACALQGEEDISLEALERNTSPQPLPFSSVFAVGDNPASDIRGANRAGPPWVSVLVRTGVFQSDAANCSRDPAHLVVPDVEAAVAAGLHRTRSHRWHSMR